MNFQGLHRTIQFSISSLALGKRQKHNISQIFYFANRFLNFFRFFSKPKFFNFTIRKISGFYISLAASSFSTRNRNIIYHRFFVLQATFKTFFQNFFKHLAETRVFISARCCTVFGAQQRHNISSFRNFASDVLKKIAFFRGKMLFFRVILPKTAKSTAKIRSDQTV